MSQRIKNLLHVLNVIRHSHLIGSKLHMSHTYTGESFSDIIDLKKVLLQCIKESVNKEESIHIL